MILSLATALLLASPRPSVPVTPSCTAATVSCDREAPALGAARRLARARELARRAAAVASQAVPAIELQPDDMVSAWTAGAPDAPELRAVHSDTSFSVKKGARMTVTNYVGDLVIAGWGKNTVRVSSDHSRRVAVRITETGPDLDVRAIVIDPRFGGRGLPSVSYVISVPAWMALSLQGLSSDIVVKGIKAPLRAETARGDVRIEDTEGDVHASSMSGEVAIKGARGRLELNTINDDVAVSDASGEIVANAVNGDIRLDRVDSDEVSASTVSGDILYGGEIKKDGRYRFSTHEGDLSMGVPERADATVQVATFSGDFESSFPVQIEQSRRGRRFNFTFGSGSALVDLQSFGGTVRLQRPHELREQMARLEAKLAEKEAQRAAERAEEAGVAPPAPPAPPVPLRHPHRERDR